MTFTTKNFIIYLLDWFFHLPNEFVMKKFYLVKIKHLDTVKAEKYTLGQRETDNINQTIISKWTRYIQ
jgi:hypothetical protein